MRPSLVFFLVCLPLARGADPFERQLSDALRDAHDRGADLYNTEKPAECYRLFQGSLVVARGLLGEHPKIQKLIADGLADAERETQVGRRAFLLHELIEKVRTELRNVRRGPEALSVPPREVKGDAKPMTEVKPKTDDKPKPGIVVETKDGVVGRVLLNGQPFEGAEIMFVSLGRMPPRVFESVSGTQGTYTAPGVLPGKYVITIVAGPKSNAKKAPERYATTTTSPLIFDIKGGGEKLDFLLQ